MARGCAAARGGGRAGMAPPSWTARTRDRRPARPPRGARAGTGRAAPHPFFPAPSLLTRQQRRPPRAAVAPVKVGAVHAVQQGRPGALGEGGGAHASAMAGWRRRGGAEGRRPCPHTYLITQRIGSTPLKGGRRAGVGGRDGAPRPAGAAGGACSQPRLQSTHTPPNHPHHGGRLRPRAGRPRGECARCATPRHTAARPPDGGARDRRESPRPRAPLAPAAGARRAAWRVVRLPPRSTPLPCSPPRPRRRRRPPAMPDVARPQVAFPRPMASPRLRRARGPAGDPGGGPAGPARAPGPRGGSRRPRRRLRGRTGAKLPVSVLLSP
jgi:hypothetical protein